MDHVKYFSNLAHLLEAEKEHELQTTKDYLNKKSLKERVEEGLSLYPIIISKQGYGLADTPYLEIETTSSQSQPHQFSSGSTIEIFSNHENIGDKLKCQIQYINGKVIKLFLFMDDFPDWLDCGRLGMNLLVDETSYKEMNIALNKLINSAIEDLPSIYHYIGSSNKKSNKLATENFGNLNQQQSAAVIESLTSEDFYLLHGPPGTGKTTTLVEIAKEYSKNQNQPILICTSSNAAIDHFTKKSKESGLKTVRIGNISKIDTLVYPSTIDEQVKKHSDYKLIKKIKQQAQEYRKQGNKYKRNFGKEEKSKRKALFQESKEMMKDAIKMENFIIEDILSSADVICTTLIGSNHRYLRQKTFDLCIIDEAAQAIEPACWVAIRKSNKIILAGDHKQLRPTVKSKYADENGLTNTLFEKLTKNNSNSIMLKIQYRMNKEIMAFSNKHFYHDKLLAAPKNSDWKIDSQCLEFIDTAGCGYEEERGERMQSIANSGERFIISKHIEPYLLKEFSIGIISPYREQVRKLKEELDLCVRIETIDSFQGQESDIIYISLVRSNENSEIGFLRDYRRMNVALTRAKKKLVIIGDSSTIASDKFYADFIDYCQENNGYRSAWEFIV